MLLKEANYGMVSFRHLKVRIQILALELTTLISCVTLSGSFCFSGPIGSSVKPEGMD